MHNIKYMLIFAEKNIKYCIMKLRLKEILEEKGLTSSAFSEMVGVHKVSISYIINGKQMPSVETLERFATALGVRFTELFVLEEESTPQPPTFICPHCGKPLDVEVQKKEKDLD